MTDRIRFVTWLLILSSCPVLKASTDFSCGTAQTAPCKGGKVRVAESPQGKPGVELAESQSPSWKAIRSKPGPSTRSAACCSPDHSVGKFPHPYVMGSLSFNGAGYSPLSEILGAGIRMDLRHVIGEAELSYDNARKTNDNTGYNPKGRERGAQSRVFYKLSNGLYFGIGAQWSQLST